MARSLRYLFTFLCMAGVATGAITNGGNVRTHCSGEWQRAISTDDGSVHINEPSFSVDREVEPVCLEKPDLVEIEKPYEPDMLLPRLFFWL
jgi:hypothetical protein